MQEGWSFKAVQKRHQRYAERLVKHRGISFHSIAPGDRGVIETLVRDHRVGASQFQLETHSKQGTDGWVAAHDKAGAVIAGLVANAIEVDSDIVASVRHLVVDPAWRGQGVGVVTLGMLPQLLQRAGVRQPSMTIGGCAPNHARFFQRAGFTVLDSGEALPFPFVSPMDIYTPDEFYPCWFFRRW
jgi:GNAT superfamily N-acetyltransferase